MMRWTWFVAAVAATCLPVAGILDPYSYTAADGGTFSLEGVCAIDQSSIACARPDGQGDPKLTEFVTAYFVVHENETLNLRYKHRSYLVVADRTDGSDRSRTSTLSDLRTASGLQLQLFSTVQRAPGNGERTLYWLYPPDDVRSFDLVLSYFDSPSEYVIAPKVGSEVRTESGRMRIEKIERQKQDPQDREYMGQRAKGRWQWVITVSGDEALDSGKQFFIRALDKRHQPVSSIDTEGAPIAFQPYAYGSVVYRSLPGTWISFVKPDALSEFAIRIQTTSKSTIRNVALPNLIHPN